LTPNFVIRYSLFGVRHSTKLQRTGTPGVSCLFQHRDSAFAVGLPELRRLVPAYGTL